MHDERRTDRLTAIEAAREVRRHPVTVRKALESGELHGAQPDLVADGSSSASASRPGRTGSRVRTRSRMERDARGSSERL